MDEILKEINELLIKDMETFKIALESGDTEAAAIALTLMEDDLDYSKTLLESFYGKNTKNT